MKHCFFALTLCCTAGSMYGQVAQDSSKTIEKKSSVNGKKYIFEIIIDKLKKAKEEYGVTIPWYVMTSKDNHDETVWF